MEVLANPKFIEAWGGLTAVAIMGALCLLGMLLSSRQFNRLMDRHQGERTEWGKTMERLFDKTDRSSKDSTKAINDLHDSLEKNTRALQGVKCIKRFN